MFCPQILAAFLLYECAKGPKSHWAPYLSQLPASYTTFFTWSAQDIAALQVCVVLLLSVRYSLRYCSSQMDAHPDNSQGARKS